MASAGDVRPLEGLLGIYEVTVPYAEPGTAGELEVLMETHPLVMASHHTAFAFHDLTDDLPKVLHATVPLGTPEQLPTGTIASDWDALPRAPARYPASILGRDVQWHRVQPRRFVGMGEYKPEGWPVRVTTPERTLIDGLLAPDDCGGMGNVLRGWARQRDLLDVNAVVELVDLLDVGVLRQRAGFVMESLGLSHIAFDRWRSKSHRGGSSKLYGGAPYASTISEVWNLSLNVPIDALQGEAA